MNRLPFEFAAIRYVHDSVLDEALNVGVVVYLPTQGELLIKVEDAFHRLSQAFPSFDGQSYRRTVRELNSIAAKVAREVQRRMKADRDLFAEHSGLRTLTDAIKEALPDEGLTLRVGRVGQGLTADPSGELEALFKRFVESNRGVHTDQRRDDLQVWQGFKRVMVRPVLEKLVPRTIHTPEVDVEFEYTFKNGDIQAIQPLSFDYIKTETISHKAAQWVGYGVSLDSSRKLGWLYLLLGRPTRRENDRAFKKAKDLLNKMPLNHELIDEDEAEDFARSLHASMKKHGLVDGER